LTLLYAQPEWAEGEVRNPEFKTLVNRDGTFRFDDMPAGDYSLRCLIRQIDSLFLPDVYFSVRLPEGPKRTKPLDLGPLTLQTH
jgi:hypothetical protein